MKLNINNLTHTYDLDVLKEVNLKLDGYKSVAIIGMSGSGKSTLVRILSGIEKPTSGEASINNLNVLSDKHKSKIGYVFQKHNLFPHLSIKRNITLVLEKTRGISKEEANLKADYYLNLLHLLPLSHKIPSKISDGEAQRASLARALSIDPEIIFLDEPTSSLDPKLTNEVLTAVENLKSLGKEFIFITHVISFVRDFADYVIYMDNGLIIEHGKPSILDKPKTELLKDFLSTVR